MQIILITIESCQTMVKAQQLNLIFFMVFQERQIKP